MLGFLSAIAVGMPLLSIFIELAGSAGISERHHSHHDTFVISSALTRSVVLSMVFMGVTGLLLTWLCALSVFRADPTVVLSFFSSFIFVAFFMWLIMRRYRVSLYDDFMDVRPFFGGMRSVNYADIESMEWAGVRVGTGYRDLVVYEDGDVFTRIPGVLDIEQILLRIDRYDVLAHSTER